MNKIIYPAQMETQSLGKFRANIISERTNDPIEGATVDIYAEGSTLTDTPIERLVADGDGQTNVIELSAPDIGLSLEPSAIRPYSEYNILIKAPGYEDVYINGAEILADTTALQDVAMIPLVEENTSETFVIGDHTL